MLELCSGAERRGMMAAGDPERTDPTPGRPDPELAHPEAAAWVLGILDEQESEWFAAGHLPSCPDCRAAVAEFGPTARLLATAAPAALPPPALQARTLAGVASAATAARRDQRLARWRGWTTRMLALAAAVVVAAGVSFALLSRSAPAEAYTVSLRAGPGLAASGHAVMRQADGGWSIQLTVANLADLGSGRYYECWWVGAGNRPGHPVRVSAGTFTVGSSGGATVQMWTAADPDDFPTMQITVGSPAGTAQGQVILAGSAVDD
jgi:anti-sigma-K factor RskA